MFRKQLSPQISFYTPKLNLELFVHFGDCDSLQEVTGREAPP